LLTTSGSSLNMVKQTGTASSRVSHGASIPKMELGHLVASCTSRLLRRKHVKHCVELVLFLVNIVNEW